MSRVKRLIRRVPELSKKRKAKAAAAPEPKEKQKVAHVLGSKIKPLACGDHLASIVTAYDRKPEKVRIGGKWIHVSYLVGGDCLRALQLGYRLNVSAQKKPSAADRLVWAIGKAVEKHIRDTVIEAVGHDKVFGIWECGCKGLQIRGLGSTKTCKKCGNQAIHYSEYHITDESLLLSGSPDLLVMVGGTKDDPILMAVEIKTIKVVPKGGVKTQAADFHSLEAPSRTHALQVLCYHGLMTRNGFRMSDECVVLYAAKDYVTCNPYKPFTVDANAPHNSFAVDALFNLAQRYAELDDTADLLPRCSACVDSNCSKAKSCPVGAHCFAARNNKLGK